jgi:hypothetical protein
VEDLDLAELGGRASASAPVPSGLLSSTTSTSAVGRAGPDAGLSTSPMLGASR